jgi:hypothetical protein
MFFGAPRLGLHFLQLVFLTPMSTDKRCLKCLYGLGHYCHFVQLDFMEAGELV